MINLQPSLGPGITSLDIDLFVVLGQGNRRQPALPQGGVDPGEEAELTLAYISSLFCVSYRQSNMSKTGNRQQHVSRFGNPRA